MEDKCYCLRVDSKLEAMVYDEEQIAKRSAFFSDGVWFEYDYDKKKNIIFNERRYKGKVEFKGLKEDVNFNSINYDANISWN